MTTKDVALVDFPDQPGDTLPVPLSEGKAKVLDKRIRQAGSRVGVEMDGLLKLLREALDGQIHKALGFPSWLAYFKDAVGSLAWDGRVQRQALAQTLAGQGVSNRAAAAILGVDEGTVRSDLKGAETSAPDKKKGADGKEYPASKPKPDVPEPDYIDGEVLDVEEVEHTAEDVITDCGNEIDTLLINVQAFKDILDDELFDKARKRLAQRFAKRLQTAITDLTGVLEALTE